MSSPCSLTYTERADRYWVNRHPMADTFLRLMDQKKTNLCLSADVTLAADLLLLADQCGPYICLLKVIEFKFFIFNSLFYVKKTHCDILDDFNSEFVQQLVQLAVKHNFLIFEDRKFADIGHTVQHQYANGLHKIASWSHITNAHPIPGDGVVEGLKSVGLSFSREKPSEFPQAWRMPRALLLLAEMSSKGSLATGLYTQATLEMAKRHTDFVIGFVAQRRLDGFNENVDFITLSPGVQLASKGDTLGQQYRTPDVVIRESGSDVIIVGRGIMKPDNGQTVAEAACMYRDLGWRAYEARVKKE